tara:strand:- start:487 stop:1326 length:840 start_codon:yes stop_codon:yes gene_type:complete
MTGRFAPSPSGHMHIGNASTALLSWLQVKSYGGKIVLRIEDIDHKRCKKQYVDSVFEDLIKLGLNWDEQPLFQSRRENDYKTALEFLIKKDLIFSCSCSRKDIRESIQDQSQSNQSYPGTCLNKKLPFEEPYSLRIKNWDGYPIIRRSDNIWSYNFAVVVDDAYQEISHIVRGRDLKECGPLQHHLRKLLGYGFPKISHAPLWFGPNKKKLTKTDGAISLKDYYDNGGTPEEVLGLIARGIGLNNDLAPSNAKDLINKYESYNWDKHSVSSLEVLPLWL